MIQRVAEASVEVEGTDVSHIGGGILVLVAFKNGDSESELDWIARKCLELRIFEDENGKMNRSVMEVEGEVLVVSQFTLYGNCRKGRRPAYTDSAPAPAAQELYRAFVEIIGSHYPRVAEGVFGARMRVRLLNDGPVTLIIDRERAG